MNLFDKLTDKARKHPQRIVLPEGLEPRTLTAADRIIADGLAQIILIGDKTEIRAMARELKLENISKATIVDPTDEAVVERYAPLFYELRKSKGISMEEARLTTANPLYLGCLMVKAGDADGQVAGAMNTTGNVLRAAFQVIKTVPGISVVSGAFVMLLPEGSPFGSKGVLVFADCAVVPNPTAEELAQIAVAAARTARDIAGITPRVALLSFSTKGSAKSDSVDKVIRATELARELDPELILDRRRHRARRGKQQSPQQPPQRTRKRAGVPLAGSGQHRLQAGAAPRRRAGRRPGSAGSGGACERPLARLLPRGHLQDHHHYLQPGHRPQKSLI